MATTGVRVFLDGTEVDCDLVGNIRTNCGGFGPTKQGRPHMLTLDVYCKWDDPLAQSSEVTVVATAPKPASGGAPNGVYVGGSTWEKCIFQGTLGSRSGTGPSTFAPEIITFNFIGDDSNMLQRNGDVGVQNNSGYEGLLTQLAGDQGYPTTGIVDGFPDNTPRPINRPAQNNTNNGQYIQGAAGAYGVWPIFAWIFDGSTAPAAIRWRPSYFIASVAGSVRDFLNVRQAWLLNYYETGLSLDDFTARIVVKGPDLPSNHVMDYEFNTATSEPPGAGHVQADDSSPGSAARLWIDYQDRHSNSTANIIDGLREGDEIHIAAANLPMDYDWNTDTTDPPTAGHLQADDADPGPTTRIWIDYQDRHSESTRNAIDGLRNGDELHITWSGGDHIKFDVQGPAIDLGSYARIPVDKISGASTFPADNENTDVQFVYQAGNRVIFRAQGPAIDEGSYARIPVNKLSGATTFPPDDRNTDVRFIHEAGQDKKGSAQLASSTRRRQCGERSVTIDTYLTTDGDCDDAAEALLDRLDTPVGNTTYRVGCNINQYKAQLTKHLADEPACGDVPDADSAYYLFADVGDLYQWWFPTAFPVQTAWPADALTLEDEIGVAVGSARYATVFSVIAGTDHQWTPAGGWTVNHEIKPAES